jgi:hypothetical protein
MQRIGFMTCLLLVGLAPLTARADCQYRRLDQVLRNGQVVQLDDGSEWQISDIDQSETAGWQQDATITACQNELINTELHETAQARQVRRGFIVPQASR